MMFDTHCHINDGAYDGDGKAMIERAIEKGVTTMLCPGTDMATSESAIALTYAWPGVYAAVGIHPEEAATAEGDYIEKLRHWVQTEKKVVAIGEVGLDYHWPEPARDIQKRVFMEQVKLAVELDVPIIIHDREAHGDTLDILRQYGKGLRGVFHCYSGSLEMTKELLRMGFYFGFTGSVVFPNSKKLKAIAEKLPMDRILIETDSPYLTPPPHRGERNEPAYVAYVASEIARLRHMDVSAVMNATQENGKRLFSLP